MKFLGWLLGVALFIEELAGFLEIPAVLMAVGMIYGFGWQYYAASLAAYRMIWGLTELFGWLIGNAAGHLLNREHPGPYEPRILRKLRSASERYGNQKSQQR